MFIFVCVDVFVMYLTLLLMCEYVTEEEAKITYKRNSGAH